MKKISSKKDIFRLSIFYLYCTTRKNITLESTIYAKYRDIFRSRLTFPTIIPRKAQKGDTVTQLRSFTVLSRPFIQGLQGNELTRSAYSQPAMISHGRRTSTTSLTRVSHPISLSVHLPECVPARGDRRLADRGYESSSNHHRQGFRWVACRINREHRRKRYAEI